MFPAKTLHTKLLRDNALALGFQYVGIAKADEMTEEAHRLEAWLNQGFHGQMSYMENHFDKRIDPRKLVDGAKTVVTLLFNYYTPDTQTDPEAPRISRYAYGKDYHDVIKKKLKTLLEQLQAQIGEINGRCFVDSAPVMERDWAKRSGTGWIGKNTLLITRQAGSYFFLAELIIDVELDYDGPIKDYCGTCKRCIEACPTQAISPQGYIMDGSKCISYLTIELRDKLPEEFKGQLSNWMFGCDICQEVCPWNRFAKKHKEPDFEPHPDLLAMNKQEWTELTQEVFSVIFKQSPVKRTKYEGLKRNLEFLSRN